MPSSRNSNSNNHRNNYSFKVTERDFISLKQIEGNYFLLNVLPSTNDHFYIFKVTFNHKFCYVLNPVIINNATWKAMHAHEPSSTIDCPFAKE